MTAFSTLLLTLTPGLYWTLDSATGATDQSGNGRNGTAVGPTIGADVSEPLIDGTGGSTLLDGVDDRITSTYNPFVNGRSTSFGGFAYRANSAGTDCMWSSSGTTSRFLCGGGDQSVLFEPNGGTTTWANPTWPGNAQWVFNVLVFNEALDTVSLYIGSSLVSTQGNATAFGASPGNLLYGAQSAVSNPWVGKLAHVFVVESALTAQNVTDLYTAATALAAPSLFVTQSGLRLA